jgi:hypothetical protein
MGLEQPGEKLELESRGGIRSSVSVGVGRVASRERARPLRSLPAQPNSSADSSRCAVTKRTILAHGNLFKRRRLTRKRDSRRLPSAGDCLRQRRGRASPPASACIISRSGQGMWCMRSAPIQCRMIATLAGGPTNPHLPAVHDGHVAILQPST